jgi:hypothetical protein
VKSMHFSLSCGLLWLVDYREISLLKEFYI